MFTTRGVIEPKPGVCADRVAVCITVVNVEDRERAEQSRIPLERLDYRIDVINHRLVGNPERGGQWTAEAN